LAIFIKKDTYLLECAFKMLFYEGRSAIYQLYGNSLTLFIEARRLFPTSDIGFVRLIIIQFVNKIPEVGGRYVSNISFI
jgi:hypothetical protein